MDHQHGLVTGFAIDKGVDLFLNSDSSEARQLEVEVSQYITL